MHTTFENELSIIKVNSLSAIETTDILATEEPLEIRMAYTSSNEQIVRNIAVTMRTPGNDEELALGFLFTEGIIKDVTTVQAIEHVWIACEENRQNVIQVMLKGTALPNLQHADRNFYTTSSCGVCGKSSIGAIRTLSQYTGVLDDHLMVEASILNTLPAILRLHQDVFDETGGLHASALFTQSGDLLMVREDVGRHNALDKLIGAAINQAMVPLKDKILLLSGRISFELVQKAAMAGINVIAAIGAPSTLAVQLAREFNITLVGFLRDERFNIYTGEHRVNLL